MQQGSACFPSEEGNELVHFPRGLCTTPPRNGLDSHGTRGPTPGSLQGGRPLVTVSAFSSASAFPEFLSSQLAPCLPTLSLGPAFCRICFYFLKVRGVPCCVVLNSVADEAETDRLPSAPRLC